MLPQLVKMPHRIYYSDKYYDANDYEYRCVRAANPFPRSGTSRSPILLTCTAAPDFLPAQTGVV